MLAIPAVTERTTRGALARRIHADPARGIRTGNLGRSIRFSGVSRVLVAAQLVPEECADPDQEGSADQERRSQCGKVAQDRSPPSPGPQVMPGYLRGKAHTSSSRLSAGHM